MAELSVKASVIILTYNRARMITESIDSVMSQTFRDFELIVVDNYSTDDTESVVKSRCSNMVRYFKNHNNGFIGINRNFGIEMSCGEYIFFLDDDDLWLPEKMERQVELLDRNDRLGLVYSDSYLLEGTVTLRENTYFLGREPGRGNVFEDLFKCNFVPMSTVAIRRNVLDKVGMFDPRYKIALDYDLWLKIALDYPFDFVNQPLAKLRTHDSNASQTNGLLGLLESLQIRSYWLGKKPELGKELGGRFKAMKFRETILGAASHVYRRRNLRAIRESLNLLKYLLFPVR